MINYKRGLYLSICGLAIGMLISIQYTTVKALTDKSLLTSQKAQQLLKELEDLKEEKKELHDIVIKLDNEISKYEEIELADSAMMKMLQEDLSKFRIISGQKSVEGLGVSITIFEPDKEDRYTIKEHGEEIIAMLLFLINTLNISGAEAISINGQRYTALTEINYREGGLFVNSSLIISPIEILAVGDSDILKNALTLPFGFMWEIEKEGYFKADIKKQNKLVVPRYNKSINYKYAKPIL
ncbi:DUF881 domain-containing protein [Alkaliphilus sp. MSJ-5]|uniref:DUF881 domain-containing protein n=1 Tax=Alkaliphilus flagellatus TaxID=2841507 RepID=A0ABS6G4H3_9FIRM|nr:DUF881 domain-containing protein [Alkaliphilus flagellatus]MBU5676261.1 DUF881 domain-containing protein [Alkaliphilus flagellatus]